MKTTEIPETPQQLRRMLARRLGIGALLVSSLAGGLAHWVESYRVEQRTLERAVAGVRHFASPAMQVAISGEQGDEHPGISQLLNDEFVGVRVFGPNAEILFDAWRPLPESLKETARQQRHPWPTPPGSHSKRIPVEGQELVQVILPMTTNNGRLAGYVEGVSLVSQTALQERKQQIRGAALTASISVFFAALLLYPLMSGLLGRTLALSSRLLEANLSLLRSLGNAIAKRDADTDAHNYRVTCYAVTLAEAAGIGQETITELVLGAFLHDVGKIGIPDQILLKPGRLTSEEFQVMQTHAVLGTEIIAGNPWLIGAAKTIRHHHERFDGKGYPDRLSGEEIPLAARIFALVDVFDALTSVRPYKPALSFEETLGIMEREAGQHFDPAIYAVFRKIAPMLYKQGQSRDHAQWSLELKAMLERHFKMKTAPKGAVELA
ncbi:MAG: HD-GYP domain-containing protein [Betaproteobacteria bacterium HGW-Betaproteobacteria-12]|nr:MAG: HD-GYP domain-containing protein [Betaproteobacteria bacterium HGW-Betaproteobacteria-12]